MRILDIPEQVAEAALSIVGVRAGTEEPHYLSTQITESVELRRYGPRVAAEVTIDGDEEAARNTGFRRLAGYIFGANHRDERIAMTAPVVQSGERIAMTAPVVQARDADNRWTIRFFMPSKWSLETLPAPDDSGISLIEVPAQSYAVLRFSGIAGRNAIATRTRELEDALRAHDVQATGPAAVWFFDPPWTLPFRRRNEIAIPVRR